MVYHAPKQSHTGEQAKVARAAVSRAHSIHKLLTHCSIYRTNDDDHSESQCTNVTLNLRTSRELELEC